MEIIEQSDRPDRKVYHITEKGIAELRDWLAILHPLEAMRNSRLIQVFFAGQLSDKEILNIFEGLASHVRAVLAQYESIPQDIRAYRHIAGSQRDFFFWMLTLEAGIKVAHANLEWLESVIERIRDGRIPRE